MKKIIVIIFLLVFVVSPVFSADIGEYTELNGGYFMASSKDIFFKAFDVLVAQDYAAYNNMLRTGLIYPTVEGEEVYIVSKHVFSASAEVRLRGDFNVYWIPLLAIEDE